MGGPKRDSETVAGKMRGGRGGGRGELADGALGPGWLPPVETSREDEHIHSEFSVLGCLGPDMDLLDLFPELLEVQPSLKPRPWTAGAVSGVWSEQVMGEYGELGGGGHGG